MPIMDVARAEVEDEVDEEDDVHRPVHLAERRLLRADAEDIHAPVRRNPVPRQILRGLRVALIPCRDEETQRVACALWSHPGDIGHAGGGQHAVVLGVDQAAETLAARLVLEDVVTLDPVHHAEACRFPLNQADPELALEVPQVDILRPREQGELCQDQGSTGPGGKEGGALAPRS